MGVSFTSTHIYNAVRLDCRDEFLEHDAFVKRFRNGMENSGYDSCGSDESEISYGLRFSANNKWVTLTSDSHGQKNELEKISKMMRTFCVSTALLDSDCAIIELYGVFGDKEDSFIFGRLDDDFAGENSESSMTSQSFWSWLLESGHTWEELAEIRNGTYVSAEDALTKVALMLGMDKENVLPYSEGKETAARTITLYFKKSNAKNSKKVTLKTLFHQIFGEALKPLGFKAAKLRQPYFIRMIGEDILHIVAIQDMKGHLSLLGGVTTVYREDLCLARTFRQNERWLKPVMEFYVKRHLFGDPNQFDVPMDPEVQSGFHFSEFLNPPLSEAVERAGNAALQWLLPALDRVQTLEDVITYERSILNMWLFMPSLPFREENSEPYCDNALCFALKDPLSTMENLYAESIERYDRDATRFHYGPQQIAETHAYFLEKLENSKKNIRIFNENQTLRQQTLDLISQRKIHNLSLLKKYGLSVPSIDER